MILAVCGPPGSGKSTIATRVHEDLQAAAQANDERNLCILHSDDYSRYPYDRMYAEVTDSDAHFVLDGTFYKRAHQTKFQSLSNVHFVLIRADLDTCIRRDRARDGIGEKAVRVIHSEFHDPPADLVINTDILDEDAAVEQLTDRARDWLQE